MSDMLKKTRVKGHVKVIRGRINVIYIFQMFCISASYLVAKFHKVLVMHSRDTGPLDNCSPFGPIVFCLILVTVFFILIIHSVYTSSLPCLSLYTILCIILCLNQIKRILQLATSSHGPAGI